MVWRSRVKSRPTMSPHSLKDPKTDGTDDEVLYCPTDTSSIDSDSPHSHPRFRKTVPEKPRGSIDMKPIGTNTAYRIQKGLSKRVIKDPFAQNIVVSHKYGCIHLPLYPQYPIRRCLDIGLGFAILYTLIFTPLYVAFGVTTVFARTVDYAVDVIFLFDTLATFVTIDVDRDGRFVTDIREIANNYLRSWFILDVLAIFPFHAVIPAEQDSALTDFLIVLRLRRCLRLARFLRIMTVFRQSRFRNVFVTLRYHPRIPNGALRLIKLMCAILTFGHFSACIWIALGDIQNDSWIFRWEGGYLEDKSKERIYVVALYWSYTTLTTVGYGDLVPFTAAEMLFTLVVQIIGVAFFGFLLTALEAILSTQDDLEAELRNRVTRLYKLLEHKQVDQSLINKCIATMHHVWMKSLKLRLDGRDDDWTTLISDMPKDLKFEVTSQIHTALMKDCDLFQRIIRLPYKPDIFQYLEEDESESDECLHTDTVEKIIAALKPLRVKRDAYVVQQGDKVKNFYLVDRGKLQAESLKSNKEWYAQFQRGDCFGHIEAFLELDPGRAVRWLCCVRALKDTTLYLVPLSTLRHILANDPDATDVLECDARELLSKISGCLENRGLSEHILHLPQSAGEEQVQRRLANSRRNSLLLRSSRMSGSIAAGISSLSGHFQEPLWQKNPLSDILSRLDDMADHITRLENRLTPNPASRDSASSASGSYACEEKILHVDLS